MLNNFLIFASMHLLTVPLPLYVERIGGGPSQVGLVIGTFAMAAILARPSVGRLVDRLGGKPSLLLGSLIFAIGPLLYIVSRTVPALPGAFCFEAMPNLLGYSRLPSETSLTQGRIWSAWTGASERPYSHPGPGCARAPLSVAAMALN